MPWKKARHSITHSRTGRRRQSCKKHNKKYPYSYTDTILTKKPKNQSGEKNSQTLFEALQSKIDHRSSNEAKSEDPSTESSGLTHYL